MSGKCNEQRIHKYIKQIIHNILKKNNTDIYTVTNLFFNIIIRTADELD